MTIEQQAALMRLGLRFIRESRCEYNWVGPVPTDEDIDQWLKMMRTLFDRRQEPRIVRRTG